MDLTPQRNMIQVEECSPNAGITQGMLSRVGQVANFINTRQLDSHQFNLNGNYGFAGIPFNLGDGYISYPYAFEIVEIQIFSGDAIGSSGTTEVDVKWKPQSSGVFQSIFTTTPKISSTASTYTQASIGYTPTGFVSPVLNKYQFDAYDYLKLEVLNKMAGNPSGLFVKIYTRPI